MTVRTEKSQSIQSTLTVQNEKSQSIQSPDCTEQKNVFRTVTTSTTKKHPGAGRDAPHTTIHHLLRLFTYFAVLNATTSVLLPFVAAFRICASMAKTSLWRFKYLILAFPKALFFFDS